MSYSERPTCRVKLVTDPNLYVDVYTRITYGDQRVFSQITDDGQRADTAFKRLVADWNLDIPLTPDNLDELDQRDAAAIFEEIGKLFAGAPSVESEEAKKDSSPKSPQPSAAQE